MQQPFDEQVITVVIVFAFFVISALIVIFGVVVILKQLNERERIRCLPKYYREGRLLVRRHNPDGSDQDLSYDVIAFEGAKTDVERLPRGDDKNLPVESRNGQMVRKDLVRYPRKNLPSNFDLGR